MLYSPFKAATSAFTIIIFASYKTCKKAMIAKEKRPNDSVSPAKSLLFHIYILASTSWTNHCTSLLFFFPLLQKGTAFAVPF